MKKIKIVFWAVFYLIFSLSAFVFADDTQDDLNIPAPFSEEMNTIPVPEYTQNPRNTIDEKSTVKTGKPGLGILLIGFDGIAVAYAAYALADQWKISGDYLALYEKIDSTSYSNYQYLLKEKKKVDEANLRFGISCGIAMTLLLYTLIDLKTIHYVFPEKDNITVGYNGELILLTYGREF